LRVEGGLDGGVEGAGGWGDGFVPPGFFCKADAVLSGDGTIPCEDLGEKFVEDGMGFFLDGGFFGIGDHDVDVDIAVARMAEAGDGKSAAFLEFGGEVDEVDEAPARDDDVFVEFFEAGGFEGL